MPRALLRTNYVDLKDVSSTFFNQNACIFEFNRDTDCTPSKLEALYHYLTDVMINKDYLVTTGEALQSLELKYFELLANKPDKEEDSARLLVWKQQVAWAGKLCLLFKNRGDLIIDEVHQGLLVKNKLNYTLGEASKLNPGIFENAIELYQFFKEVRLNNATLEIKGDREITLDTILKDNSLITEPTQLNTIMDELAQALMNHAKSPLYPIIQTLIKEKDQTTVVQIKKNYWPIFWIRAIRYRAALQRALRQLKIYGLYTKKN